MSAILFQYSEFQDDGPKSGERKSCDDDSNGFNEDTSNADDWENDDCGENSPKSSKSP